MLFCTNPALRYITHKRLKQPSEQAKAVWLPTPFIDVNWRAQPRSVKWMPRRMNLSCNARVTRLARYWRCTRIHWKRVEAPTNAIAGKTPECTTDGRRLFSKPILILKTELPETFRHTENFRRFLSMQGVVVYGEKALNLFVLLIAITCAALQRFSAAKRLYFQALQLLFPGTPT